MKGTVFKKTVMVSETMAKPVILTSDGLANLEKELEELRAALQEKEKELFWMMEQDRMVGRYVGDRMEFDKVWESGDYDADFINIIEDRFVEMVREQ